MASARSSLYRAARMLGTVDAARKGPAALARRQVRRVVYRHVNATTARVLNAVLLPKKR